MKHTGEPRSPKSSRLCRWLTMLCAFVSLLCFGSFLLHLLLCGGSMSEAAYPLGACFLILLPLCSARFLRRRLSKKLFSIGSVIYSAGVCLFCLSFVSFSIYLAAAQPEQPSSVKDESIILVFGGGVRENAPSPELKERLDLAVSLLRAAPSSLCIVSGGSGETGHTSEAFVMYRYLTESGILPQRIFLETSAADTRQNIVFSMELMKGEEMENRNLICVSSDYHIPRIRILCREYGLKASFAASSPQNPLRRLPCMVREYMAYIKMFLHNIF